MERIHLEDPEVFAVGTVGEPGRRVFYLQAGDERSPLTFKVEKQQVAALSEHLRGRLADLPPPDELAPVELREPGAVLWAVGPIGVGYDGEDDRIVIELTERLTEDSDGEPATATLRVTRAQAAAVVRAGAALVEAGRPPCPLCGGPLDPEGHTCPRKNGHRPPRP